MLTCAHCGAQNKDDRAFCEDCGTGLSLHCPSCGAGVTPGKRFCGFCGSQVLATAAAADSLTAPQRADPVGAPVAERRVCSVLFCDLVGFTPLSESRDPEEVRELLSRYFDVSRTMIGRYGGIVEKFIGDAVMAVWGTPVATEGDAERAVRAGLDLVDAVAELGRECRLPGLAARAGIVTGEVAVTVGATGEGMVAGDAVNTAARVQATAEPGTVLVDEGTWRVAQAAIEFVPASDRELKGTAHPVPLWRADRVVSGVGGSQRIDGLEAPFVGRDAELRLVKELFHASAQRRTARLVSVTGAAGVGKSRLGWEFFKYIDGLSETVWWHRGRCLSYGEGVAFWALAEMVRQRLGIAEDDPTDIAAEKLRSGLDDLLPDPVTRSYADPRLSQLLGTDSRAGQLPREELFAGWRLFFERLAGTAPVVLMIEDLHHADAGLLDFLEHLLDWARNVPIFVLTLARPELENRRPGWGAGRRNSTALTLDPLDDAAMSALLDGLVPGMPEPAKTAIAGRAEGIPLYAVETVRMLIDHDVVQPIEGVYRLVGDVGELAVPSTLQSLLAARLDALDPAARRLIADAAVLGNSFPRDALVAVSDLPTHDVDQLLKELVRREVLAVRADPLSPERGQYGFVQTMFRQVAYDTLSRRERKARHLAVADHLRQSFGGAGEELADVIAAHLLDALAAVPDDPDVPELRSQAVDALTRAGERAERTAAPASAMASYARAADLLQDTGTAEDSLAAAMLERAGAAARTAGDLTHSVDYYRRAAELYRRYERPRDAARADVGVGWALRRLGRAGDARVVLQEAVAVLESNPDADTVAALGALATLETSVGTMDEADRLSVAALALAQALGVADGTINELLIIRGLGHATANRRVQAVACLREAVRRAELLDDGVRAGHALTNLADVVLPDDPAAAADAARRALPYARRTGDAYLTTFATGNLIQALVRVGEWDAAEEAYETTSAELGTDPGANLAAAVTPIRALRGESAALHALREEVVSVAGSEDPQEIAQAETALAMISSASGEHRAVIHHAQRALAQAEALGIGAEPFQFAWPFAVSSLLTVGDRSEARRLLDWLDAHPPGHVPAVLHADRLRLGARLRSLEGDAEATTAFEAALAALRRLGLPYHLAVGLLDQADHLATVGDRAAAAAAAREAGEIARRLRALPLLERAERLIASGLPPEPMLPAAQAAT